MNAAADDNFFADASAFSNHWLLRRFRDFNGLVTQRGHFLGTDFTVDLPALTRTADVLVAATGKRGLITGEHVSPGAIVIDVGITRDPETGKLTGDVERASVEPVAGALTPVPGGVGPMTVAMLLVNTYRAYRQHLGQA